MSAAGLWQADRMVSYSAVQAKRALQMVRRACLALPEVNERPSHGGPAFFVRDKRCLVMFVDDHHGDGRLAIWCAAPEGVQTEMVQTEPDRFFVPPYVGYRGWLGVELVGSEQDEVNAICRDAFCCVAPVTVRRLLGPA
ncbi:MAG: MmcQ/YjbR family DNA-binding protein [Propionibacteriaceae bacterium]